MPTDERLRRSRLSGLAAAASVDAVLVTRLVNVRYLTGFTGSAGVLLLFVGGGDPVSVLATDGRYQDQAAEQCGDVGLLVTRSGPDDLLARAAERGAAAVGFEPEALSFAAHRRLSGGFPGTLVGLDPLVERLRMVKDPAEVDRLRVACQISDAALAQILTQVRVGSTERRIAADLEAAMRLLGADGAAFESIVAGGPHSAIPHHEPTDRPLERGDLLKIDFGARVQGYHADQTRTFVVGAPPEGWQSEIHAAVLASQAAGVAALAPGVAASSVDAAARAVVSDAGWGEHFTHGLGHGVGLEIHEAPFLGATSPDTLAAAVPVTVEPGVYLPGRGGVRIEDTLVVGTEAAEPLTTTPRDLLVLDR
jgi:Xaa-Pro aminopeptidase